MSIIFSGRSSSCGTFLVAVILRYIDLGYVGYSFKHRENELIILKYLSVAVHSFIHSTAAYALALNVRDLKLFQSIQNIMINIFSYHWAAIFKYITTVFFYHFVSTSVTKNIWALPTSQNTFAHISTPINSV